MLTATKARPALARTSSSIHASVANTPAASFLASSDIFDSPGRLILDEDSAFKPSIGASRRYYPSHFRPPPDQTKTQIAASSAAPATHTHKHLADQIQAQAHGQIQGHAQAAQVRQISTLSRHHAAFEGSAVMFDKPARPRHALLVTSRHSHTRSASSSASLNAITAADMKDHVPPPPLPDAIVYKNPARPPRKIPVQHQRSAEVSF